MLMIISRQVKQGGDVPDLSPEEKEKSKKLADAWIKMDKAKEAKEALKVNCPSNSRAMNIARSFAWSTVDLGSSARRFGRE